MTEEKSGITYIGKVKNQKERAQMHPVETLGIIIVENDGYLQFIKGDAPSTAMGIAGQSEPYFLLDEEGNRAEVEWPFPMTEMGFEIKED